VIELARSQTRILLTEDRDFGRLVFAAAHAASGVIYIRFPAERRSELPRRVLELVEREALRLETSFTVVGLRCRPELPRYCSAGGKVAVHVIPRMPP
jgi:hypothetical protein